MPRTSALTLALVLASIAPLGCSKPCPAGSLEVGAAPPDGVERWCQRDDGHGNVYEHGRHVVWWETGNKKRQTDFVEGKRSGEELIWHENGRVFRTISWKDGLKDGPELKFFEDGRTWAEGEWHQGKRHGRWCEWSVTGKKVEEGTWLEGERHGRFVFYDDERGVPRETAEYVAGRREGVTTLWHHNGQKAYEGTFEAGRPTGVHRTFDRLGHVLTEGPRPKVKLPRR